MPTKRKLKVVRIVMYYDDHTKAEVKMRPPQPKNLFDVVETDEGLRLRTVKA